MAIVQISRIQHRKGLQQDLPNLASAELGWSIDTRQLYIGNGTISEGAPTEGVTEILTQYSDLLNIGNQYTFKGAESGYTSQTGPTALTPIQRTLQQKLDDIVNVRDFGATGDGSTDDTAAIQRAIDEVYFGGFALTQPKLRRALHFSAGTYLISSSLKLPSYAILVGEGNERVVIRQTSNLFPLLQLKDSSNQIDLAYGTLTAQPARYVEVMDVTLEHSFAKNIVQLDSCNDVGFSRVIFRGSQASPNSVDRSSQNAVYAVPTDPTKSITNLRFSDCAFTRCTQGLILNADNVKIHGCDFSRLSRAVWVDTSFSAAVTRNVKIAHSSFDSIAKSAIYVTTPTVTTKVGVMSVGNFFGEVGTDYAGAGNPVYPVIYFAGSGNYSVGDSFERGTEDRAVQPRVFHALGSLNASYDADAGVIAGMVTRGPGRRVTINPGQTNANTGIVLTGGAGGTIEYVLQRPDASAVRKGKIEVLYVGSTVQYTDEFTETPNATNFVYPGPTGVTFSVQSIGSNQANLSYTSNESGTGTLTYSITNFQL
jgi:hypothetical protein